MAADTAEQIQDLLAALDNDDVNDRVIAIQALGEIGDERVLRILRKRLATVNKELVALIAAVGKLKRRLAVK